jgi:hypothetical protein
MSRNWSGKVTQNSRALMLEPGIFTWNSPRKIAKSLKESADISRYRKGTSYQSSMSMLNFYINRAGTNLTSSRRQILEQAKIELRKLYKRDK